MPTDFMEKNNWNQTLDRMLYFRVTSCLYFPFRRPISRSFEHLINMICSSRSFMAQDCIALCIFWIWLLSVHKNRILRTLSTEDSQKATDDINKEGKVNYGMLMKASTTRWLCLNNTGWFKINIAITNGFNYLIEKNVSIRFLQNDSSWSHKQHVSDSLFHTIYFEAYLESPPQAH